MKRTLKLWSDYFIFLGVVIGVLICLNLFIDLSFDTRLLVTFGGFLLFIVIGNFIFKPYRLLDSVEEPILLESVFDINYNSIERPGVSWCDIVEAKKCLMTYKKLNNFNWCTDNLFDILVVYYVDDTKKELKVKVLKNTRKLVFNGVLKVANEKIKLDTLDLSNFNTKLLVELKDYTSKLCKIEAVRPIDTFYLKKIFDVEDSKLKSNIYNVEEIIGGAF